MNVDEFFTGYELSRQLFESLLRRLNLTGQEARDIELRVSKSQIALHRAKPFAWVWIPDKYLKGRKVAPLVLTLSFPYRHASPRWKEIVEPAPGRFTHHLELYAPEDVDEEVREWLGEAWRAAGAG